MAMLVRDLTASLGTIELAQKTGRCYVSTMFGLEVTNIQLTFNSPKRWKT